MIKDLLKKSRSYRGYDESYQVTREQLTELVDCARYAPSSVNLQPLKYRLVCGGVEKVLKPLLMMQENISLDRITVKEIIKLTRTYYRNPISYQAILALSELQNYTNHPMDKLSGGQKRKLQFALTLAGNPDLIFLDEPTVGMDAESRTKFWERIDELKKQGKTFLITSHYLEELEKVANRFIFLHNQRIIFDGSLTEMGKQLKKVQVTFNSELIKDIFNKLPAVLRVSELNHHYTLITSDVNSLITQLVPYLSAIDNLEIRQQNLDTLMDSLIRNEE